ncbi:Beta-lactamase [Methylocella silvestris BL2]|uniref:Beta-lactamase n=1 Tax=Methylocella silvestris (strain DSM 15510 / CIP 108128 / LMG 27833 / NCIMB 13906 / BL2) TaxID=395965 RepID=B8EL76_METSB|nr:class A beta-lactamase [Methylocella silvestris]ACK49071.1 Beta-lactamase [Methylocella silvestris BL2]
MIARRDLLIGSLFAGAALFGFRAAAFDFDGELQGALADLEQKHGGRLGVAILDTATMRLIARRGDERFPLCSTFKFLAAAFVLARVDRKEESLARRIIYASDVLVAHSPITGKYVGGDGLTVGEICEAAVTVSDNTAGNLLLDSFGGPAGLTAYVRSLGDNFTRIDRRETELNEAAPGDPRDTTTPLAMLEILHKTVLGTSLSAPSRQQMIAWLVANTTGGQRLRSGAPKGWRVGDKTGSGENNTTNDIAIIWPPQRAPLIVTAYYTEARASAVERDAVLSEVGRLAADLN